MTFVQYYDEDIGDCIAWATKHEDKRTCVRLVLDTAIPDVSFQIVLKKIIAKTQYLVKKNENYAYS